MDRKIVYPAQVPLDTDILDTNRFAMVAIGKLAKAVLGNVPRITGLVCTTTTPASIKVKISEGEIYFYDTIDISTYGSLPADTNKILKCGTLEAPIELNCAPSTVNNQTINYLIQAKYSEIDTSPVALPFVDSSNPLQTRTQNTVRKGLCLISVKAGVSAPTGYQSTPSPDEGWVPLYVVKAQFGSLTIRDIDISYAAGAPFIDNTKGIEKNGLFFTTIASTSVPSKRWGHAATLLNNGIVFVSGGANATGGSYSPPTTVICLPDAYLYYIAENRWTAIQNMPIALSSFSATTLLNGNEVCVCGGTTENGFTSNKTYIYSLSLNSWRRVQDMPISMTYHAATLLQDGRVFVVGRDSPGSSVGYTIYDPISDSWSARKTGFNVALTSNAAVTLLDGRVIIFGGTQSIIAGSASSSIQIYIPTSDTWTRTNITMPKPMALHSASLLPDGRVLICGGTAGPVTTGAVFSDTYIYDPFKEKWSVAQSMQTARFQHASVSLADGRVFVCGGQNISTVFSDAFFYNPTI